MSGYNRIPWNVVVIFLIILVGIGAVEFTTYDYQTEQIKVSKQNELSAINDLKINEIVRWHQKIADDWSYISKNKHFVSSVEQLFKNPDNNETRQDVTTWMKSIQENQQYENAFLLDSSGNLLVSYPEEVFIADFYTHTLIEDSLRTKKILFSDFHKIEGNGEDAHIKMLIPLVSQDSQDSHESSVAVLVVGIDHSAILNEIVLSRPIPSESYESLIVRREGDNVIFLNELRHKKNTTLSLSIPANQADLPAAMAVTGTEGIVEGIDYRGVEVLASVRAIPDTPWFMITKVDANEIYVPIYARALSISFIIDMLIIFSGIGIGFFWQHQNTQLLNSEKKSQYTRDLIETSLDLLLSISPDGKITEVNKATERVTGISRNQLIGTDFSDYFTKPDLAKKVYQNVWDEGVVKDRQLVVRHVSGDTTHVIFNGTTYLDEAGNIQSIFAAGRDITEHRRAEDALKESHNNLEIRVKERTADLLDANVHLKEAIDELSSAKITLAESEEQFRLAFEMAAIGMGLISPSGGWLKVNPALCDMLGYTESELLELDFQTITHKDDLDADLEYVKQLLEGTIRTYQMEKRYIRKDGEIIWINFSTSLLRNSNGDPLHFISQIENITERKKARIALQESERRLLRAQEVAHVGDWEFDVETNTSIWSDELYRIYGLESANKIDLEVIIAGIHPKDRDYVNEMLAGWIENGTGQPFEYRVVRPNGSIRHVYSPAEAVRDSTGKVVKMYGTALDITERTISEVESILNSSRMTVLAQLGKMLDAPFDEIGTFVLENGVTLTKSKFGFVGLMNEDESVFTIYSWSKEVIVGCEVDDKPIEYPIKDAGLWSEAVRQRKTIIVNDYLASDLNKKGIPQGHLNLSRLISIPIFDGDKIVAVAAMANKAEEYTDSDVLQITLLMDGMWRLIKNKNMMEEIRQMNIDLEQKVTERTSELTAINKELEAFSHSVSHDLRAPLRSVDGFSLALLEDYGDKFDETGTDYINRVRNATKEMAQLIDDLLSLSRITQDEVVSKEVDLSELILDIAEKYKSQISEEPDHQIEFGIDKGAKANGDKRLLKVMLENLISNACKFTSKEPIAKIEFGITRIKDKNTYFIRDNGVGFDMKYADKLFGTFQRLHSKSEFPGTGIGLATVKRIVHKHGGHVWAESELGKGAIFYFTI